MAHKKKSGNTGPIQPDLEAERAFGAMVGWKNCQRCTRPVEPYVLLDEDYEPQIIMDRTCPACCLNDLEIRIKANMGQQFYVRNLIPEWKKTARQLKKIIRERAKRI